MISDEKEGYKEQGEIDMRMNETATIYTIIHT